MMSFFRNVPTNTITGSEYEHKSFNTHLQLTSRKVEPIFIPIMVGKCSFIYCFFANCEHCHNLNHIFNMHFNFY